MAVDGLKNSLLPSAQSSPQVSGASQPTSWRPLVLVCLTGMIVVFNASVLATAISRVVSDLGTTVSRVQAAIVAYALLVTAFTITGGKVSALIGPVRTQLLGLGIYALGMGLCIAARSIETLIAGQAIAGIGGALLIPNSLAILGQAYSGEQRTLAVSIQAGTAGIGSALALLLGGILVQNWGWRAPFLFLLPMLAVTLGIGLRTSLPTHRSKGTLDVPSILWSASGVLLLVVGINQIGAWGLLLASASAPISVAGLSPVLMLLMLGGLLVYVFLARQRRLSCEGRLPLFDSSIVSPPLARACLWGIVAINLLMAGLSYLLPLYLQIVLGMSPFSSAMMIVPLSVSALVSAAATPALMRTISARTLLTAAHLLSAGAVGLLAITVSNQWGDFWTVASEIAIGLGLGVGLSVGSALLMDMTAPEQAGDVGSARGVATFLGISAGTALAGTILLSTLAQSAAALVGNDPTLNLSHEVELTPSSVNFVSNDDLRDQLGGMGYTPRQVIRGVEINVESRLVALRASLFALAVLTLAPIVTFRHLPRRSRHGESEPLSAFHSNGSDLD